MLQGARVRSVCMCVSDYLKLCFVKTHEEGVKSIATNAQRHTSVPQSYVCFGYLRSWDGDVTGEARASVCESAGDELEVPRS